MNDILNFFLKAPRILKILFVVALDLLICWLSLISAYWIRTDELPALDLYRIKIYLLSSLILVLVFTYFKLYKSIFRYLDYFVIKIYAKAIFIYGLLVTCITYYLGDISTPRSIYIIQSGILFFIVILTRSFASGIINFRKSHIKKINVLIYGVSENARALAAHLQLSKDYYIHGYVDEDNRLVGSSINGIPIYSPGLVTEIISRNKIAEVYLALNQDSLNRSQILSTLENCKVRVRTLSTSRLNIGDELSRFDLKELDINDLLGRPPIAPDHGLMNKNIESKVVVITGAGGSIGSELCRQILLLGPNTLILIDNCEHALYQISSELEVLKNNLKSTTRMLTRLTSIQDSLMIHSIFNEFKPQTVFHAAAFKHVPIVEDNIYEAVFNNVFGTEVCARASINTGVQNFVLISTDKAVRPTNIMGATKRVAELILQALNSSELNKSRTCFSMVRFGNVLGSSGSVVPLFHSQIKNGGPITLTHLEVTRYFMSIPEAAQLVIQSSGMASGGEVYILDMGDPVKIVNLAKRMIFFSGLTLKNLANPNGDIEITITGMRPGEKLYEELLIGSSPSQSDHPKIMKAEESYLSLNELEAKLELLYVAVKEGAKERALDVFYEIVSGFSPQHKI